jgi:hypothetical protein
MDSDLMRWVKAQADDPNANPRFRELLVALEAAREDAERAAYWRQRAKSAEGHLFASDMRAAAAVIHEHSVHSGTPWEQLSDRDRCTMESVASRVLAAVNVERYRRRPNGAAIDQARGKGEP